MLESVCERFFALLPGFFGQVHARELRVFGSVSSVRVCAQTQSCGHMLMDVFAHMYAYIRVLN